MIAPLCNSKQRFKCFKDRFFLKHNQLLPDIFLKHNHKWLLFLLKHNQLLIHRSDKEPWFSLFVQERGKATVHDDIRIITPLMPIYA